MEQLQDWRIWSCTSTTFMFSEYMSCTGIENTETFAPSLLRFVSHSWAMGSSAVDKNITPFVSLQCTAANCQDLWTRTCIVTFGYLSRILAAHLDTLAYAPESSQCSKSLCVAYSRRGWCWWKTDPWRERARGLPRGPPASAPRLW